MAARYAAWIEDGNGSGGLVASLGMRLLLGTHSFLWFTGGDDRLSGEAFERYDVDVLW